MSSYTLANILHSLTRLLNLVSQAKQTLAAASMTTTTVPKMGCENSDILVGDLSSASACQPLSFVEPNQNDTAAIQVPRIPSNTPVLSSTATFSTSPSIDLPFPSANGLSYKASGEDDSTTFSSFDISLISDTSSSFEEDEYDTSWNFGSGFGESTSAVDIEEADAKFFTGSALGQGKVAYESVGLGISGMSKKNGSGPFDGLGIVSVRSSAWRTTRGTPSVTPGSEGVAEDCQVLQAGWEIEGLSRTFLEEALYTLTEDPFHGHVLESIPECAGEYEQELEFVTERASWEPGETPAADITKSHSQKKLVTLTRDLSTGTISSELKRLRKTSSGGRTSGRERQWRV